ncbi:hypothetical protein LTSEMIN_4541, partial [Salmonella enterica subsp. enterica serovar Minnesota str. A4-603]
MHSDADKQRQSHLIKRLQSHMFKQRLAESVIPFTYHYAIW